MKYAVETRSMEYGRDLFYYDSEEEALKGVVRLRKCAEERSDGVDRIVNYLGVAKISETTYELNVSTDGDWRLEVWAWSEGGDLLDHRAYFRMTPASVRRTISVFKRLDDFKTHLYHGTGGHNTALELSHVRRAL